jgi:integrase
MIYKNGRYYMVKFMWQGKLIRKSTRATEKKTARTVESQIRSELAKKNYGILERKPSPTLSEFLKKEFIPFTQGKFQTVPKTLDYYLYGTKSLLASDLANLQLDEITDQNAGHYAAGRSNLSVATVNCGLRTLRRALNLAADWGKLDRKPKIGLAKGERRRERVLTDDEAERYLQACLQPWHDVATIIRWSGLRPGEVFCLRWENLAFNGDQVFVQIPRGKSKAARRVLPMMPQAYQVLKARWESQSSQADGWIFPSASRSGHFEQGSAKNQHAKALKISGISPFEPYILRHTALTEIGKHCDTYTLARIAGHSSITITERYVHPQAEAIMHAFEKMAIRRQLVTEGGHPDKKADFHLDGSETVNNLISSN